MRRRMGTALFVVGVGMALVLALGGAPPQPVQAAGPYSCDEPGLDAALAAGGVATFACTAPTTITTTGAKTPTTGVTLDGGGLLTLSGNDTHQLFVVNSGVQLTIMRLTLTHGYTSSGFGGAIDVEGGTLAVRNSAITRSVSNGGGGIDLNTGMVTVTNSTIANNSVVVGGGGGGIYNESGTLAIANSTIAGNNGSVNGGGILIDRGGTLTLTNSTVFGNTASYSSNGSGSGGVSVYGPTTILNSTIAGNTTSGHGGGVLLVGGSLTLRNSLIVNNTGMIGNDVDGFSPDGTNRTGAFTFADGTTGTLADNGGPTQTLAINAMNTTAYQQGDLATCQGLHSTGVDGTDYTGASAVDQRGAHRIVSNLCSIGAFEPGLVQTLTTLAANPTSSPYGQPVTLTATISGILGGTPASGSDTYAFEDNGNTISGCGSVTRNGSPATCMTPTLGLGNRTVSVNAFPGDTTYAASPTPNTVMVNVTPIACVVTSVLDPSESGKLTLRDAVNAANAGACTMNQITFDPVTNGQTIVLSSGPIVPTQTMTLTGNGASQTTIQPPNSNDAFDILRGSFTLSALTFHGGYTAILWRSGSGSDTLSVSDTVFDGGGAGLWDQGAGTIQVARTLFRGASSFALIAGGSTTTVVDSTFTGNATALDAGSAFAGVTVTNSTFVGNGSALATGRPLTLSHSIVAGSSYGNCTGNDTIIDGGGNFAFGIASADTTCPATFTRNLNPLLDATVRTNGALNGIQTFALLPGSPAIDASSSACPSGVTTDARNLTRSDGKCDSGSFESQGFTFSAQSGSPQATTKNTAFPIPLGLTVTSSHMEPVVGGVVTFTGPGSGAGITGSPLAASITGTAGATSGTVSQSVTANGTSGAFTVTASTAGVLTAGNLSYALAIDTTVTSISRTIPLAPLTNTASVTYTVVFADPISGLTSGDFVVTAPTGSGVSGASVTNVSGSGTSWTVTVSTGTGDGDLRLDFTNAHDTTPPVAGTFTTGQVYTLDKTAPTLTTMPTPLPAATVGQAYSASFVASDAHTPVITGATGLPSGFTFTPGTGAMATLTGTPTTATPIMFTVQAQDAAGNTVSQPYTITVNAAMLRVTAPTGPGSNNGGTSTMPTLRPGASFTLLIAGGSGPYSYQSGNANLLAVDNAGTVTGLAPGTVTITVTGAGGAEGTITIVVTTVTGGGLTNPNAQPMTHATVVAPPVATPQPQPGAHPSIGGGSSSGGVQPQAAGATPTAPPAPQPARH